LAESPGEQGDDLLDLDNLFAGGADKRGQTLPRFLPQQAQPGAGAEGGFLPKAATLGGWKGR
jgi:hypothetical protein